MELDNFYYIVNEDEDNILNTLNERRNLFTLVKF